jgi:hypothetical protein
MVLYRCYFCNFITKNKPDFKRHQNRKFSCKENENHIDLVYDTEEENTITQNNTKITQNNTKITQNNTILETNLDEKRSNFSSEFQNIDQNDEFQKTNINKKQIELCSCEWCGKKFKRYFSRDRHYNICKKKKVSENLILLDMKYNELKSRLENIENTNILDTSNTNILDTSKITNNTINNMNTTNNTTTTTNNTTNSNINIQINNFGNENLNYITEAMVRKLLKGQLSQVIPQIIKNIYCNPEHMENMNVYIQNKKEPFIMIKSKNGWILDNKKDVMFTIMENGRYMFDDRTHGTEMSNKEQTRMEKVNCLTNGEIDMNNVNIGLINNKQHLQKTKII